MPKAKPQNARLERSTFITSRQLEYFSRDELGKQIGHDIEVWPLAITKELIDNALDACEAIPVPPQIIVTVEGDRISVADNAGAGLPEDTLKDSQNYAVTVSNKAHYKSPLRGRQGNALKTVWAAPFVFNGGSEGGGEGRIEVVTPSYAYEVLACLNRIAQEPRLTMNVIERELVKSGSVVTVEWRRLAILKTRTKMQEGSIFTKWRLIVITVALGTGVRRGELLALKVQSVNLTENATYMMVKGQSVEVLPNCLLVPAQGPSKRKYTRTVPLCASVRTALVRLIGNRSQSELVFTKLANGVNDYSLRNGFEQACFRAEIPHGINTNGGVIFHDLRRTFATRLRANNVHPYDISFLFDHQIQGITKTYARESISNLRQSIKR